LSFWKSLFGGGGASEERSKRRASRSNTNGFTIRAAPYKAEGQYQTAGVISKDIGGGRQKSTSSSALTAMPRSMMRWSSRFSKARQIVDQQGRPGCLTKLRQICCRNGGQASTAHENFSLE